MKPPRFCMLAALATNAIVAVPLTCSAGQSRTSRYEYRLVRGQS